MAFKKAESLHQVIVDGVDIIIEESGNSSINLRKAYWEDAANPKEDPKPKYELRKYNINNDGVEVASKGVTFLTEDGPDIMVETLLKAGFGRTPEVINAIKDRGDFAESIERICLEDGYEMSVDLLEAIKKNG